MASYTFRASQREEHLTARRWTLEIKTEEGWKETAANVVEQMMVFLNSQQGADLDRSRDFLAKVGATSFADHLKLQMNPKLDEAEQRKLNDEMEKQGVYKWLADLGASSSTEGPDQGDQPENRSRAAGRGSDTAVLVARCREAGHALGFGPDLFARAFNDSSKSSLDQQHARIAEDLAKTGFVPGASQELRKSVASKPWDVFKDAVSMFQIRTCLGDDALLTFAEQHPAGANLVILGAGLDTRFYRLSLPDAMKFYEVDTVSSQKTKRSMLGAAFQAPATVGIEVSASARTAFEQRVTFVPCDFTTQSWLQVLLTAGLDKTLPTFFIWEGVTYYLPQNVIEETLQTIATEFAGVAAGVYFDYASPQMIAERQEAMKAMGEPWIFGAEPEKMVAMVEDKGLRVADHLSGAEALPRYLPVRSDNGESVGVMSDWKCYMIAGTTHLQVPE